MSLCIYYYPEDYVNSGYRLKERNAEGESVTQTHRVRLVIDAIIEKQ